ncbi:radical SAM protein [Parvibaculaceae bacterium PLY_AMNH_Bact1]|nr:radical SAM protein [Parvibaculaceae bacterium PLY_AMNH_Bact1]
MNDQLQPLAGHALAPFTDPSLTAKGEARAHVSLTKLETLWFNTGTLCNIECASCYIESSPKNDRLVYLTEADVASYLDEIERNKLGTREIGFTGGEPFMNPSMIAILEDTLRRGLDALVLTNAMQPLLRPTVKKDVAKLIEKYGKRLTFRVSLDHYSAALHDEERGPGAFTKAMEGLAFLSSLAAQITIAGRTCWGEDEESSRAGYAALFSDQSLSIDANDPLAVTLFPEMDENVDVPEITTACWSILNVDPNDMMCATSRMVVKHKGASAPTVAACTLLPYDSQFDLGTTLAEASKDVALNHRHCAKFCVLGGGSCSA